MNTRDRKRLLRILLGAEADIPEPDPATELAASIRVAWQEAVREVARMSERRLKDVLEAWGFTDFDDSEGMERRFVLDSDTHEDPVQARVVHRFIISDNPAAIADDADRRAAMFVAGYELGATPSGDLAFTVHCEPAHDIILTPTAAADA